MSVTSDSIRISENVAFLREQIAERTSASGRNPDSVELLAVTKTQSWEAVSQALLAGITQLGENRIQEALEKIPETAVQQFPGLGLHFIGHLQKNKVKKAVSLFSCIQSIDSAETMTLVNAEAERQNKTISVLFEVNTSGEASKNGCRSPDELFALTELALKLPFVHPKGLMTIGPLGNDESRIRSAFASLRSVSETVAQRFVPAEWGTLSMGMSGDWQLAVEEGSTMVRIGTALFGPRLAGGKAVVGW